MIKLENITKEYYISKDSKVSALQNVSLSVGDSGMVAIVGKSGSGKTTLLNILGGLDMPTSGYVTVDGVGLDYKNRHQLDLYRGYTVSFVFQDFNLLEDYSVIENVKLGVKLQGVGNSDAVARAKWALEQVGLAGYEGRKISSLSGGQKQRVAIARALCKDSEIVLCDEPTGNLDSNTSNEIFNLIKTLSKDRVFIIVTHDEESAYTFCDRVVKISDGRIVHDITIGEVESKPAETVKKKTNKRIFGLGFVHCMQMIRHNVTHSLFGNIAMLLLLTICFTLSSVFVSLSQYEEKEAFLTTIQANDQYILSITKYEDSVIKLPNGNLIYGYQPVYDRVSESDIESVKRLLPKEIGVYSSYYFAKPFSDFKPIEVGDFSDVGYAFSFKEAIVVENFETFLPRLVAGSKPVADNDVLIYDFMAASLIERGIVNGDINGIVGHTLTDTVTGMKMRISGILASKYQNYLNQSVGSNSYDFAVAYLSGLRAIYCKSEFVKRLEDYKDYISVIDCSLACYTDDSEIRIKNVGTQIRRMSSVDLTYFAVATDMDWDYGAGVIVSLDRLARFMNRPASSITQAEAQQFIDSYQLEYGVLINDADLAPVGPSGVTNNIIAVCNESIDNDGALNYYSTLGHEFESDNGSFRQLYLGLCNDWTINKAVIDEFWYPEEKPYEFYIKHPKFYDEVFADYDPAGFLIREANEYLVNVKETAEVVNYIVLGLSVLVVIVYTIFTLRKYNYKIGVLKALGAKTFSVILIFGLQLLLVSLLAFLVSLPLSFSVLAVINSSFVKGLATNLVLFSTTFSSIIVALLFATLGIAVVSGIPLVKLAFTSPIKTIAASRNKA